MAETHGLDLGLDLNLGLGLDLGPGRPIWACGAMSGTSMDGLDLALIETDGERISSFGPSWFAPMWPGLGTALAEALPEIAALGSESLRDRRDWPDWLRLLDARVTEFYSGSIAGFVSDEGLGRDPGESVWQAMRAAPRRACLGLHGQTVLHRPEARLTVQLFDPALFRAPFGRLATVSDFRSADMGAGGEGAPLAPFYHWALARWIGASEPLVFLNIGGVANLTWVDPTAAAPEMDGALLAFDTGPGNALIDDFVRARAGVALDIDGRLAGAGTVRDGYRASNAAAAHLARPGPKSLDRNAFQAVRAGVEALSTEDGAATLTAFTADCVAAAQAHLPRSPARWLVCGGGRRNPTLMAMLRARLGAPVDAVEAVGLDGDMLEAQAFGYLAVRVLRGLSTSAEGTTGCRKPVCGGVVTIG
ncbi:MAG: anhydro-N-acetylmuramic acid kinase [Pseudomonadota bacterium]